MSTPGNPTPPTYPIEGRLDRMSVQRLRALHGRLEQKERTAKRNEKQLRRRKHG